MMCNVKGITCSDELSELGPRAEVVWSLLVRSTLCFSFMVGNVTVLVQSYNFNVRSIMT